MPQDLIWTEIRQLMRRQGITCAALIRLTGLSPPTVYDFYHQRRQVRSQTASKMLRALRKRMRPMILLVKRRGK